MKLTPLVLLALMPALAVAGCAASSPESPNEHLVQHVISFDGGSLDLEDDRTRAAFVASLREQLARDGFEIEKALFKQTRSQELASADGAGRMATYNEINLVAFYKCREFYSGPGSSVGAVIGCNAVIGTSNVSPAPAGNVRLLAMTGKEFRALRGNYPKTHPWVGLDRVPATTGQIAEAYHHAFDLFRDALVESLPGAVYSEHFLVPVD